MHVEANPDRLPLWKVAANRLFFTRDAAFWLKELRPLSAPGLRARVVRVVDETPDTRTFVLRPNRSWKGHRAGQYVPVEVEVEGVRTRRCYSISSAPGRSRTFSITVKRVPGGRVSNWLHDRVQEGDVLGLGEAAGDFVLPDRDPEKILLVSAGSGVTPVFALLEDLAARDALRDVVLVHYARRACDVIFHERLRALAERHPGFRLVVSRTREGGERFDADRFDEIVPDFRGRETWLCGPAGLMDAAAALWEREGIAGRLHEERFVASVPAVKPGEAPRVEITLSRSGRTFASGAGTLLEQAERAGARPESGCRMGICQTCKCVKRSGAVRNLRTGEVSAEPDEEIQLCISVPQSDVEIDL